MRTTRHHARTTRGDLLARSDSGIKLNERLSRIFFRGMCFFLSFKCVYEYSNFYASFFLFFDALLIRKKPTIINFDFFQLPLTLCPVTGRRLDYTIFSVDIVTLCPVTGRRLDYTIFSVDIGVTD